MSDWILPGDPLVALRGGDPGPFEEFVRLHARTLVAFFRQRGATPPRAEDLAQEVFLKLYQGSASYRPEERFAAYFFRVARNVWIDDCRRAATRAHEGTHRAEASELEPVGPPCDPGAALAIEEESARLGELLGELSPTHRRVFELAVLGELSYTEIASILSIPLGTVKSRMFYAIRRLRLTWERRREHERVP